MAAERRHGIGHGRRQTGIIFDRVLIKSVALRGVQIERAMKIHGAPRRAIRDQRHGNARGVAVCEGGASPRSKPRIRPDIIDPTRFAGPNRHAGWPLTCFRLAPGHLDALQVIETVSRLCHRPPRESRTWTATTPARSPLASTYWCTGKASAVSG